MHSRSPAGTPESFDELAVLDDESPTTRVRRLGFEGMITEGGTGTKRYRPFGAGTE